MSANLSWHARFEQVRAFRDEHGRFPAVGDPNGQWPKVQRRHYRSGQLSAEQIAAMESMPGWNWNPRRGPTGRAAPAAPPPSTEGGRVDAIKRHVAQLDAHAEVLHAKIAALRAEIAEVADERARANVKLKALLSDIAESVEQRVLPPESEWRTDDAIMCLECGAWKRALGAHLRAAHDISAAEYRERWGMRQRQPLTCGEVSAARSEIANRPEHVERMRESIKVVGDLGREAAKTRERRAQELAANSIQGQARAAEEKAEAAERVAAADAKIRESGFVDRRGWIAHHYIVLEWSLAECDEHLGAARGTVQRWMRELGIPARRTGPRMPTDDE